MITLKKQSKKLKSYHGNKYVLFRPQVKSRHPSHNTLRTSLPLLPFKSIVRLGSITDIKDTVTNGGKRIEFNTIKSIRNSFNKLLMKNCFTQDHVVTSDWTNDINTVENWFNENVDKKLKIVAKNIFGSRGTGNTLLSNFEEFSDFVDNKYETLNRYIFERFYNYSREYRLHVTKNGCFYTCRKMLKEDTPEDKRWYRNDSNCIWILEENEQFDKPSNWDDIIKESVKALNSVGLDAGAVDVKVQSKLNNKDKIRKYPKFIIIEINSAPSFGNVTLQKYIDIIPKILKEKYELCSKYI